MEGVDLLAHLPWRGKAGAGDGLVGHPGQAVPANQPRHLLTVAERVPSRSATAWLLNPSPSARMICARNTSRCSVLPTVGQDREVTSYSLVSATSTALIPAGC
jgi:hypothetical protein